MRAFVELFTFFVFDVSFPAEIHPTSLGQVGDSQYCWTQRSLRCTTPKGAHLLEERSQKPGKNIGKYRKYHRKEPCLEPGFPWFSWIDVLRNMSCQMEMLAGDSSGSAVVRGTQSGGTSVWERRFYLGRTYWKVGFLQNIAKWDVLRGFFWMVAIFI
jgi:hypothetical protein